MRSMTGYGRGIAERDAIRVTVDLRAVNHRFLDLKLRASLAPAVEDAITQKLRGALERGAVAVAIHVDRPRAVVAIDKQAALAAHKALAALAHELDLPGPDLATLLAQPGVTTSQEAHDDAEAPIAAAVDAALAQLVAMRATEGAALAIELATRLDELARARGVIATHAEGVAAQLAVRLHERIAKLAADALPDPQRLAQEVALLADRADITEELVRLASHLEQARALVAEPTAAVGRRLDFLVQEIGRELNTIGAKSVRTEISAAIVDAKATLEKLREQVQNVE